MLKRRHFMPINNCIASPEKVEQSSNQKSVPSLIWTTILVYRAVCVVLDIVLLLIEMCAGKTFVPNLNSDITNNMIPILLATVPLLDRHLAANMYHFVGIHSAIS